MVCNLIVGCSRGGGGKSPGQVCVVAELTEMVEPPRDDKKWQNYADFVGIYKFIVTSPLRSGVAKGTQLNVVIPRNDVTREGFTKMKSTVREFKVGATYRLTVTTELPAGWESIRGDFSDGFLGFSACLAAEPEGYGGR